MIIKKMTFSISKIGNKLWTVFGVNDMFQKIGNSNKKIKNIHFLNNNLFQFIKKECLLQKKT